MAETEAKAIGFPSFGGLRLDQALDEVGANNSIYQHDVDWDGSLGRIRTRDGFQKLNASAASGEYKGLYPHSALRLLAVKRISGSEAKIVALDKEGAEKTVATWPETEAPSTFASVGSPAGTFTFMRSNVSSAKVVRFDGTTFTEPTCNIENVTETGETEKKEAKEFPKGRHMVGWPDASNALVIANTAATGGPNGAVSSNSTVWISRSMPAAAATPLAFEETAFLVLGAGDGEEITGVCVYGAQLYVFKETRFWVVSRPEVNEHGQPVYSFREVTLGSGSRIKQVLSEKLKETSDRICWPSQDGVFFCTTDGIYQTNGGSPSKISQQLKPLEETVPFEGPMAEFLNGSTESFRWPATGICLLGRRIFVKRYEFLFVYDIPLEAWNCWKMPSVSMAVWTGLTGGGAEVSEKLPGTVEDAVGTGTVSWTNPGNAKVPGAKSFATAALPAGVSTSHYLKATNFGFALPVGAIVVGIEVSIYRKAATEKFLRDSRVRIVKGGTIKETEDKASSESWPTEKGGGQGWVKVYGGGEDLWGNTWLYSDLNASNFGVAISVENYQFGGGAKEVVGSVEGFTIKVTYLSAEAASGVRPRLFSTQSKSVFWTGPSAVEEATFPGWAWESGLYDLGSEDEKELVKSKLWGNGTVNVSASEDFKAIKERHTFELGEETTQKAQNISQKATFFSHRFSGTGKAQIQRFVRYLRTTATSGSQSDPS